MSHPKNQKSKRSLLGYIIYPRIQLKFAVFNALLLFLTVFVSLSMQREMMKQIFFASEAKGIAELSNQIELIYTHFFVLQIGLLVISTVIIFLITGLILHRFLGPIVSIIRYFEDIRTTGKGHLRQRTDDCLVPLQKYLDTVEISVKKKNQDGMTIVEVLVGIFILSIAMLVLSGNMAFYNKQIKNLQTKSTQSDVMSLLRVAMKDPASIYNSGDISPNSSLNMCLQGIGSNPCENNVEKEFNLYSPLRTVPVMDPVTNLQKEDAMGKPLFNPEAISGISSMSCENVAEFPVFYTPEGQRCACTDTPTRCPLQAVSTFTAYCASGSSCQRPSGLKVSYYLHTRPDLPATAKIPLAEKTGSFFVSLNDDDYFIKFVYGASFNTDITTGNEYVSYSVGEFDIRQGSILNFEKPSVVKVNVSFSAKSDVSSVELMRYSYPSGCNSNTIGTVGTIDCHAPSKSEFVKIKTEAVTPGKTGFISFSDSILDATIVEYDLIAYDSGGNTLVRSAIPLRIGVMENGFISVTPPAVLTYVCDIEADSNKFIFVANGSKYGWKSVTATISPPLIGGITSFPDFSSKFSKDNPNPQKISIDPNLFNEGVSYEITFKGITGDDYQRISKKTFSVGTKPTKGILSVTTPAEGAIVRVIQDLTLTSKINLPCGQTAPKIYNANIKKTNGTSIMPDKNIKGECVSSPGNPDENQFTCTTNLTCDQWLNVQDSTQCTTKFASDTGLNAFFNLTDDDGNTYNSTVNFTAGSKISLKIAPLFVQFVSFKFSGISFPATTLVDVQFSSGLLDTESIGLKLIGPGESQSFICKGSGAGTKSTYNSANKICTLSVSTPTTSTASGVYTLTADDPSIAAVIDPKTVTFKWVDNTILSCNASDSGAPNCGTFGKNLQTKITPIGNYSNNYWISNSMPGISSYTLSNTNDNQVSLDFFAYYRPTNSSQSSRLNVALSFGQPGSDYYVAQKIWYADKCNASPYYCAANYDHVSADFYASKKIWGTTFGIQLAWPLYTTQELLIVRECYCQ